MKILVVGGGGREHALAWKIAQSPLVKKLYCAPGNAGIAQQAECVGIGAEDVPALRDFAVEKKIDLTVVGPEVPLTLGLADALEAEGLKVFGPSAKGAEIEGSKVFAKKLMYKHSIPTAAFKVFQQAGPAHDYIRATPAGVVVKADGLAAGKGVLICKNEVEAHAAVDSIMRDRAFGDAGDRVIIEELLHGQEASVLAFSDGRTIVPLIAAQDHKRALDGDRGLNTGGMGAYAPAPLMTPALSREVEERVLVPLVHALNRAKRPYKGIIYAGIMVTPSGVSVLEFNCRFGDPETQPIMMMLKSDIVPLLLATAEGTLENADVAWHKGASVCVVMAGGGYPGPYENGKPIRGIQDADAMDNVKVFHAGTAREGGDIVTAGGRVLGVTAQAESIRTAQQLAYDACKKITFEGAHYRKDIAAKAFR